MRQRSGGSVSKTILVADDSKTIQEVVRLTFEKSGFEVVTVWECETRQPEQLAVRLRAILSGR